MKLTKIIVLTILLSTFSLSAQDKEPTNDHKKEHLKGLHKATNKEMKTLSLQIGPHLDFYTAKGKEVPFNEVIPMLQSGKFTLDPYLNTNSELKAGVFRATTEEEEKEMKEMQNQSDLVGTKALGFSATDINGKEYSLDSLKGKIIVMNFWFIQCKPCIMEMPELNKLVENYKNEDVIFLGFAMNKKSKLKSFLKKTDFSYTIIPDSEKVVTDYKVTGFPTHIIVDKDSKIVFSTSGLGPTTIADIEKTIEQLIKK
jgi:thiol-disulfide isomerase/thioredoxin